MTAIDQASASEIRDSHNSEARNDHTVTKIGVSASDAKRLRQDFRTISEDP